MHGAREERERERGRDTQKDRTFSSKLSGPPCRYRYIYIYIYIKLRGRPLLGYDFQAQGRGPLSHSVVYGPLSQHWNRFLSDFGLSGFPRETYLKPWTAVLPSRWVILEGFGRFLEVLRCPGVPKGAIWKK